MMRRRRQDQGVTVVVFAVTVTALLAVGSLVMGGSNGYSAARNAQTAADAASVAATKTMREVWQGVVPLYDDSSDSTSAVYDTAVKVAEENGADPGSVECDIVTAAYAISNDEAHVLGPCDGTYENALASDNLPLAGGVRVRLDETRDVPLGGSIDREEITASAVATATVQPLRGGFRAPFMVCAFGPDHGVDLLIDLDPPDDPTDDPSDDHIFPPYKINPAALNVEFLLWANGNGFGSRNCDVSSWHGVANDEAVYQVPSDPNDDTGWWDIDTGSRVGHVPGYLSGHDTCDWENIDLKTDTPPANCRLALPLCVETNASSNGTKIQFNCVRMGTFLITYVGPGDHTGSCVSVDKKVVCGRLLGEAGVARGGEGTLDPVDPFELAVIKLVQ